MDLAALIKDGQVAWLNPSDIPPDVRPAQTKGLATQKGMSAPSKPAAAATAPGMASKGVGERPSLTTCPHSSKKPVLLAVFREEGGPLARPMWTEDSHCLHDGAWPQRFIESVQSVLSLGLGCMGPIPSLAASA